MVETLVHLVHSEGSDLLIACTFGMFLGFISAWIYCKIFKVNDRTREVALFVATMTGLFLPTLPSFLLGV